MTTMTAIVRCFNADVRWCLSNITLASVLTLILLLSHTSSSAQSDEIIQLERFLPHFSDSFRLADAYNKLAILNYEVNWDTSQYYAIRGRDPSQRLSYGKGKADAANNLGVLSELHGDFQQALYYYSDALRQYKSLPEPSGRITASMNTALAYFELEEEAKAKSFFDLSFSLAKENERDSSVAVLYANYASCFLPSLSRDSFRYYIERAKLIASSYHNDRTLLFLRQIEADRLLLDNQKAAAASLLRAALQQALSQKMYYTSVSLLTDLGDAAPDSSAALSYYMRAAQMAKEKKFRSSERYVNEKLYDFYQAKGDDEKSILYSQNLLRYYDEQKRLDQRSGVDYTDYLKKEEELASSRRKELFQKELLLMAVVIVILVLILLIDMWRNWQKSQQSRKTLSLQLHHLEATSEELDRTNKKYLHLIKVVAHDLRNPISSINMASNMIESEELSVDVVKKMAAVIKKASDNCYELVERLLHTDLSQDNPIRRKPVNIASVVEQSVSIVRYKASQKKQTVILKNSLQKKLLVDGDKIARVLNNLLINAVKFSPEGSSIEVDSYLDDKTVTIRVKDKGIGIPPQLAAKLFDPFTSAKRKGTEGEAPFGLGLYISKQIVEAHKGTIRVESEEGKGATFIIELPLKQVEVPFEQPLPERKESTG